MDPPSAAAASGGETILATALVVSPTVFAFVFVWFVVLSARIVMWALRFVKSFGCPILARLSFGRD
jgi:hypothetical protein